MINKTPGLKLKPKKRSEKFQSVICDSSNDQVKSSVNGISVRGLSTSAEALVCTPRIYQANLLFAPTVSFLGKLRA